MNEEEPGDSKWPPEAPCWFTDDAGMRASWPSHTGCPSPEWAACGRRENVYNGVVEETGDT